MPDLSTDADAPGPFGPPNHAPAGEELYLTVWEPAGLSPVQDGVETDLPGGIANNEEIVGASLASPHEGMREEWTIEAAVLADGLGPEQLTTAARHRLTVRRVEQRSPDETRVVFAPI